MSEQPTRMPETEDAKQKLRVVCPKCGYALVGLQSQRCPECGENHGVARLWAHYLVKTKPGKFINDSGNRPFLDISLEPVRTDSTALRYERRFLQTPLWLLGLGTVSLIATLVIVMLPADTNATRGWSSLLFMLGAAFIGFGMVLVTHRRTVDVTEKSVTVRDRIAGFESVRDTLAIDAVILSFEHPPTILRKRWFSCVLFTQRSHVVLWAGKNIHALRLYENELPPPMKALHVSLVNDQPE